MWYRLKYLKTLLNCPDPSHHFQTNPSIWEKKYIRKYLYLSSQKQKCYYFIIRFESKLSIYDWLFSHVNVFTSDGLFFHVWMKNSTCDIISLTCGFHTDVDYNLHVETKHGTWDPVTAAPLIVTGRHAFSRVLGFFQTTNSKKSKMSHVNWTSSVLIAVTHTWIQMCK